jgi:hypothetical protein
MSTPTFEAIPHAKTLRVRVGRPNGVPSAARAREQEPSGVLEKLLASWVARAVSSSMAMYVIIRCMGLLSLLLKRVQISSISLVLISLPTSHGTTGAIPLLGWWGWGCQGHPTIRCRTTNRSITSQSIQISPMGFMLASRPGIGHGIGQAIIFFIGNVITDAVCNSLRLMRDVEGMLQRVEGGGGSQWGH